jgi:uncharacterized repeat protein (TIGR03833 family)
MRRICNTALRVPTTREVVGGARVNIVQKADQPTGRTISGTVRDVLTRGDHHRGIKVRLVDGRIGRVQSMDDGAPAVAGPQQSTDGGVVEAMAVASSRRQQESGDEQHAPSTAIGLDAYIKPARTGKVARRARSGGAPENSSPGGDDGDGDGASASASASAPNLQSATATCPVCGDFEGDEAAVSHHVASHFPS